LKMGMLAYDEPTIVELPDKYTLEERRSLSLPDRKLTTHPWLGRQVGFAVLPTERQWQTEVADSQSLKDQSVESAGTKSNLPHKTKVIPEMQRAVYGSFVPAKIRDSEYYVRVGVALSRFKNVATGKKTFNRLEQSKEEFGGNNDLSDKAMIVSMSILSVLSLASGVGVFFLL